MAQYPVLRTAQSALHPTVLASNRMLQLIREGCSKTYPPMSVARYTFIQLSELEQCRVKKGFNTSTLFEPGFS